MSTVNITSKDFKMNYTHTKSELPKLNIAYDELKSIVIDKIKNATSFQFNDVVSSVTTFINTTNTGFERPSNTIFENKLNNKDVGLIREIIWDLIIQRILSIGNFNGDAWQFLSVTEYGQRVLNSTEVIPHDPSKYIERVKRSIPDIDTVIITYLDESINTYNINKLLSATIALGCASEKALLLLIDTYTKTFNKAEAGQKFEQKIKNRMIKIQFEEFQKDFKRTVGLLPKGVTDNYENVLLGVFEMLRNQRNFAGHPTGYTVDKEMLFANLQVFVSYCRKIYDLINFFHANKHD